MKMAIPKQQVMDYPPKADSKPARQSLASRGVKRLLTPGKWLERAVLFLCLAVISAIAGFLGSGSAIFNSAWMISTASLLLGVISLFLDNSAQG